MNRVRLDGAGRRLVRAVAIMAAAHAASQAAGQTVIYVDDDASPGGGGTSWQTAFVDLQDALNRANTLDRDIEIRIAEGVYLPDQMTGDRSRSFRVGGTSSGLTLTLKGGFAGIGRIGNPNRRDVRVFQTIISGDLNGDDGPNFANRDENSNRLLYIESPDWRSAIIDGIGFQGSYSFSEQSAVKTRRTGLILVRCQITGNQGWWTSAVSCDGSLKLYQCDISGNRTSGTQGRTVAASSHIESRGSSVSENGGGGIQSPVINLYSSTISMNSGTGIDAQDWVLVSNSVVWNNGGGALLSDQITINPDGALGGGYSVIMGWDQPGPGTIVNEDPRFVDPIGMDGTPRTGDEDLRLMGSSPAVDRGVFASIDRDRFDLDDDGDLFEPAPFDLTGSARVVGSSIDMGAYEFQFCPADLTASSDPADPRYGIPDGMVTAEDFFVFLDLFSAGDPRADLTGSINPSSPAFGVPDGRFDAADFFAYLAAFELGCP